MIVQGICDMFFGLAGFLLGLLPAFPKFTILNQSLAPVFYCIRLVNIFVSVQVVGVCCALVLVVYNLRFIWSAFMWLIRKIPGVS